MRRGQDAARGEQPQRAIQRAAAVGGIGKSDVAHPADPGQLPQTIAHIAGQQHGAPAAGPLTAGQTKTLQIGAHQIGRAAVRLHEHHLRGPAAECLDPHGPRPRAQVQEARSLHTLAQDVE